MANLAPSPAVDFASFADAQSRALAGTVCLTGAAITVALWPFDLLVRASNPSAARILFAMRVELLAIYATYFAVSAVVGKRLSGVLLAMPPAIAATGVFGLAIGQLAREDNYWFISLYMLPMICMPVLMPLAHRICVAALCVVTPLAGFALSFTGSLSVMHVAHALGLFVMAATFGVYGGDVFYRQAREAFALRRDLDARRTELATVNADLEARVEAQTRDLRRLAARLDDVIESERRRLASDLQDDLGQQLTSLRLEVGVLRATAREEPVAGRVARVAEGVERSFQSVRRMLESLRPRILEEEGVDAALRWLARQFRERTGRGCEARLALGEAIEPSVGLALFRILQEALSQAERRAEAWSVVVDAREADHRIALAITVEGPGAGFDEGPRAGLVGMRERALAAGGSLEVRATETGGTRVEAALPTRGDRLEMRGVAS